MNLFVLKVFTMNINLRYIPYSGNRYIIDVHGVVYNDKMTKIKSFLKNDKKFVELEWLFGKGDYEIGLLMLVSFMDLWIPEYRWLSLEPIYKDKNSSNTNLCNISYRFKEGPLEVENRPGFYYIPFNTYYCINREGVMLNVVTGRIMTWWVTKPCVERNSSGGYRSCRVIINKKGDSKMLFRHRALCLVFHRYDEDIDDLVVNHIDGQPKNDKLDNLEWTTYSKNNQHAYDNSLRPNAAKPVLVKDLKTNIVTKYTSVQSCAKAHGHTHGTFIRLRILNSQGKLFSDYKSFKYDDGSDWVDVDLKQKICRTSGGEIIARNVFTGVLILFTGTTQGEKITGVKASTILSHVSNEYNIPINGFNFRYFFGKDVKWPTHTEKHLAIYKDNPIKPPNGVMVTNITDDAEEFYTSVKSAADAYSCKPKDIINLIHNGRLLNDKYIFKMFYIKDIWSA